MNRLFELRGDLSQSEMAAKLGMSQTNYSAYELGKQKLNSKIIELVCSEFGVSADWLLGFDVPRRPAVQTLALEDARLIELFHALNPDGKKIAINLLKSLVSLDPFRSEPTAPSATPASA